MKYLFSIFFIFNFVQTAKCQVKDNRKNQMVFENIFKGLWFLVEVQPNENDTEVVKNILLTIVKDTEPHEVVKKVNIDIAIGMLGMRSFDDNYESEEWRIIEKDFNFDGEEDFAIMVQNPLPCVCNPAYQFYLQKNEEFYLNKDLGTDVIPLLNKKTKTLIFEAFIGGGTTARTVCKWQGNKLIKSKTKFINH